MSTGVHHKRALRTEDIKSDAESSEFFSFDYALWKHYTVFDGLAGMHVEDIHQDRRGFIWVATADGGVSRFDGVHYDNLTVEDGLPHPSVMSIVETDDGNLWFGTLGGGVAEYDGTSFRIYTIEDGLPSNDILGLQLERDGSIWVLSEKGIGRIENGRCLESYTDIDGQPLGYVYDIVEDRCGTVWLATMDRGVVSIEGCRLDIENLNGTKIPWAWKFAEDKAGGIWIAARYIGADIDLWHYSPREQEIELVKVGDEVGSKAVHSGVRHVRIDKRNWVWAVHRGVVVYDGISWRRFGTTLEDINFSDTRLTYEDREGNIWVGLWGGGLIFCDPASVQRFSEEDGLPDREVRNLAADRKGRIWIGTMGGMARWDRGGLVPVQVDSKFSNSSILALVIDRVGRVWGGNDKGEVFRWDGDELEVMQIPLSENEIFSLYEDSQNRIWVCAHNGTFLVLGDKRFITIEDDLFDSIFTLVEGRDKVFWMVPSGSSTALCRYDGTRFQVPADKKIAQIRYISAICETPDGLLWIGAATGLFSYDHKCGEVNHYTMKDGLSENAVSALAVDHKGNLWIGTSGGGAVYYDGEVFKVLHLGNTALENKIEAILCDGKGDVWFGTRAGLALYQRGATPPGVVIRQVEAGETYWEPERIKCPARTAAIRIVYQGIGFRSGYRQMCYSYRLTGAKRRDIWAPFSSCAEVVYRDLAPGKYRFAVRAMDRDGLVSDPAGLEIEISSGAPKERIRTPARGPIRAAQPLRSKSPALRKTLDEISLVADTDVSILILGETGTGKGVIARAIHDMSSRREQPFISLNCGAIPEGLVESDLFGHEKGAFTGALSRKIGHFEMADQGTLFLDEIGNLPLRSQQVLLHILDDGRLNRVGGGKSIPVNVRVLAATNCDLLEAIQERTFRDDLYYRLNGYAITLPPLRQRREDIPFLAKYFAEKFALHYERPVPHLDPGLIKYFQHCAWPGNIRELEHLL